MVHKLLIFLLVEVLEVTVSGTLADGDTTIVNADGTVSAVVQTGSGWITTLGDSGTDDAQGIAIDSSGNIIVLVMLYLQDKG